MNRNPVISLHRCSDLSTISDLKAEYIRGLIAPMDGMWNEGFTDPAPHWEIRMDGELAGYYAANDEGTLLQFHVRPKFEQHGRALLDQVIAQDSVKEAVVGTIDLVFLSYCLDVQKNVRVHTYLYEVRTEVRPSYPDAEGLEFRLAAPHELERTVAFQQTCLSGDADLTDWLRGYSGNLIDRKELHVLCRDDEWLGLGECRRSDSQQGVADVGMMVAPDHRRRGWGAYILTLLTDRCRAGGMRPICSTTVENVGAQKAIMRAGFASRHRIMTVAF